MSVYIKQKSDGLIMHSCSSQTVTNPAHLKTCQDFVTNRGMSLNDFIIGDATEVEIQAMIKEAETPTEKVQAEIARLEATVTPRRIREMTTVAGAKWVDDVEKLIAIERAKL